MSACTEKKLGSWIGAIGTCLMAVALSACGGGSDEPAVANSGGSNGGGTSSVTNPAVPAPSTTPSRGLQQSGNLAYLVTQSDGTTRTMAATVAFNSPRGALTLEAGTADAFDAVTNDGWATVVWPAGKSGALRAEGNAGLVCTGNDGGVGVSHNMTLVSNPLEVIKGKTFEAFECIGGKVDKDVFTFNQDGSANVSGDSVSAQMVAAAFSEGGFSHPDGGNTKLRLYAWTTNGQTTYHFVETGRDALNGGGFDTYVILGSQVATR